MTPSDTNKKDSTIKATFYEDELELASLEDDLVVIYG